MLEHDSIDAHGRCMRVLWYSGSLEKGSTFPFDLKPQAKKGTSTEMAVSMLAAANLLAKECNPSVLNFTTTPVLIVLLSIRIGLISPYHRRHGHRLTD